MASFGELVAEGESVPVEGWDFSRSWQPPSPGPPNVELARRNLAPLGASVGEVDDEAGLPFPPESFDLVVTNRADQPPAGAGV